MYHHYFYLNDSLDDFRKDLSYFFFNESDSKNEEIFYNSDYKPIGNKQQKAEPNLNNLSTKEIFIKEKGNNTKKIKSENYQSNELNNLLKIEELEKNTVTLGRKRKDSELKMNVTRYLKYKGLNIVKNYILKNLLIFINDKLKEIYQSNIGVGIFAKKLLSINLKKNGSSTIIFNKEFLDKSIGNIFSEDINTRYSLYLPSHNRDLIKSLLKEEDNNKSIYFNKVFNLTFRDVLKYFRGSEKIEELNGMKRFDSINKDIKNNKSYLNTFKYNVNNFEEILGKKRKRREKIKEINIKDNNQ